MQAPLLRSSTRPQVPLARRRRPAVPTNPVQHLEARLLFNAFTVTSTADTGAGSLRAAILAANAAPGRDRINFNIPAAGVQTILPQSPLPPITDPVVLDGYSQPGASKNTLASGDNAVLLIELNGSQAGAFAQGLLITQPASGSTVRGLVINRFTQAGITLQSADDNVLVGNFIGTNPAGSSVAGNTNAGILITDGSGNRLGGHRPGARNLISGTSFGSGVEIDGPAASCNRILGNFIGTDASGTLRLRNFVDGVTLNGAPQNNVGGTRRGDGNLISGNAGVGVSITGATAVGNILQGNLIGTDVTGTAPLGNTFGGVSIAGAPQTLIGGDRPGAGNVISGNPSGPGVSIHGSGATGNTVQGNLIGTDLTGTASFSTGDVGVSLFNAPGNLIGGTTPHAGNVISGNRFEGVQISGTSSTGNQVQGNLIGTDTTGQNPLGNRGDGIAVIDAPNNLIGGTDRRAANVIAFNRAAGVSVTGSASGAAVRLNSIFSNGALGIDLAADGVTPNDPLDADTGPNALQNFPVLTSAKRTGGTVLVRGTLDTTPGHTFVLDFFASPQPDPTGFGQGRTPLGSATVQTDATGHATLSALLQLPQNAGTFVTATATDVTGFTFGQTSEFSQALATT